MIRYKINPSTAFIMLIMKAWRMKLNEELFSQGKKMTRGAAQAMYLMNGINDRMSVAR